MTTDLLGPVSLYRVEFQQHPERTWEYAVFAAAPGVYWAMGRMIPADRPGGYEFRIDKAQCAAHPNLPDSGEVFAAWRRFVESKADSSDPVPTDGKIPSSVSIVALDTRETGQ